MLLDYVNLHYHRIVQNELIRRTSPKKSDLKSLDSFSMETVKDHVYIVYLPETNAF